MSEVVQHSLFAPELGTGNVPVFLSLGMGYDSVALLLAYLFHPELRDFDLKDLIVVTAMTGDEWPETKTFMETVVLPLLRQFQIRFIQVARKSGSDRDGIVILNDTRNPTRLFMEGAYKLSTHLLRSGIVPMRAKGMRRCSLRFKGWVLDKLVEMICGTSPRRRLIGFNADETKRVKSDKSYGKQNFRYLLGFNADEKDRAVKDKSYGTAHQLFEFPLILWGWGRKKCEEFVDAIAQGLARKSACVYCCFACSSGGRKLLLRSYAQHTREAGLTLLIEHIAMAVNPTQKLYGKRSARSVLEEAGNVEALRDLHRRLDEWQEWAVYKVRRIFPAPKTPGGKNPQVMRSTQILYKGTREESKIQLEKEALKRGCVLELSDYSWRFWTVPRGEVRPYLEEMYVICPAVVEEKQVKRFEETWQRILNPNAELALEVPSRVPQKGRRKVKA
ncbi:hypothetical protein H6G00_01920 [Leptolyngbya sp. FACHB-541]|uniref:hypothetical protein n=1 Tax=Leptolyngbya sp. FACHB-541 TaxID=2692810 RepID=UPI001683F7DB|nr:hypothetical protein [Leptolyngbya sp. FACHB-541]MBD1995389.1 hypothetical protein [Leptolyngbya sp. FACHB-541]